MFAICILVDTTHVTEEASAAYVDIAATLVNRSSMMGNVRDGEIYIKWLVMQGGALDIDEEHN